MARALSSAAATKTITQFITRRGYAAGTTLRSAAANVEEKVIRKAVVDSGNTSGSSAANSWIPDPVTGYYRPANRRVEVDAAELRRMLLSKQN